MYQDFICGFQNLQLKALNFEVLNPSLCLHLEQKINTDVLAEHISQSQV